MKFDFTKYKTFISIPSVVNNTLGNKQAIEFVTGFLTKLGFDIRITSNSHTEQPTIIAHYSGRLSTNKVVIYGHYDVAPVKNDSGWVSRDPFILEKIENRLYGRGIADNKGPLMARMLAMESLVNSKKAIPEILWLIQGEEEITEGDRVAHEVFKHEIPKFDAKLYIEETGFNHLERDEQIAFLWSPDQTESEIMHWKNLIASSLNKPNIEYRHLNKLNGIPACPLLSNLPQKSIYIGFGPNDRLHFIHRDNESLDERRLITHQIQFEIFLAEYALFNYAL